MKKLIFKTTVVLLGLAVLQSCNKDLNLKPTIEINEENLEIEVLKSTSKHPCL